MTGILIEAVGWISAVLILAAYMLLSSNRIASNSIVFQGLNAAGAAGFIVNSGWNGAWPSAVLNVIWLGIALLALTRIIASSRKPIGRG